MAQTNKEFDFELVSPEKKLMSEKAWQVTIPGYEGDFGVRANHSALVAAIRPGVVSVVSKEGDKPTKIFIAGGFADVTADNCTVLAEEAVMVSDMNKAELEAEMSKLDAELANAKDDIERARYKNQLALNKAKMVAISSEV